MDRDCGATPLLFVRGCDTIQLMTEQTKLEIRPCRLSEVAQVGAFYDEVVWDLVQHTNWPKWIYKEYPSVQYVRQMASNGQFVCKLDGKLVGAFVLNEDPQGAYERANWSVNLQRGEYLVCHAVAVAVQQQGKGIGKQIVEFCKQFAKSHGYKAIRLDVVPTHIPAKKLYESCGFVYRGDVDLLRDFKDIPVFAMYEYNIVE